MNDPLVAKKLEEAKEQGYSNRPWGLADMLNLKDNATWVKQYIGSYDVRSWEQSNGTFLNFLYDKKDCHSLYYHKEHYFFKMNHLRSENTKQGTTYQFYFWSK